MSLIRAAGSALYRCGRGMRQNLLIQSVAILTVALMLLLGGAARLCSINLGREEAGTCVTVQADGKILVGGYALQDDVRNFVVIRLNPDGTTDTTFDDDGIFVLSPGANAAVRKIAVSPDGSILFLGDSARKVTLGKLLPDGRLDPSFGTLGLVSWVASVGRFAGGLHVDDTGKILVGATTIAPRGLFDQFDVSQVFNKLLAHGSPDPSFGGGDGEISHLYRANENGSYLRDMAVGADGRIVTIGDGYAFRYLPNGSRDASFHADGIVKLDLFTYAEHPVAVTVAPTGKIYFLTVKMPGDTHSYLMVARYTFDGKPDPTFDGEGWKVFPGNGESLAPINPTFGMIDPAGRLVVTGTAMIGEVPKLVAVRIGDPPPVYIPLQGTVGDDTFRVNVLGPDQLRVQLDGGFSATYDFAAVLHLAFDGRGGNDKVYFVDGFLPKVTTLVPHSTSTIHAAGKYLVSLLNTETNQVIGKVNDLAYLDDSPGDDTLIATGSYTTVKGAGFENSVVSHSAVYGRATRGGNDSAHLYDKSLRPPADDHFTATPTYARLESPSRFVLQAAGFDQVFGHSSGGNDTALLIGSAGSDSFTAMPSFATLSGIRFVNRVFGFRRVEALGGAGIDQANFVGAAGKDLFESYGARATLSGTGFANVADQFETSFVSGGPGDIANLVGSTKADSLVVTSTRTQLTGLHFDHRLFGFQTVTVNAGLGADTAYLRDSAGNDTIHALEKKTTFTTSPQKTTLVSFSKVTAQRSRGTDVAYVGSLRNTLVLWGGWTKRRTSE